ncbi:MAG: hypothetical protein CMF61_00145 [Magnetococcales bacterium]|nr:hypothetical protein [Magnetococcales bacterium]PPR12998.1 MAG: hypothetical protein CFH43_01113 [Pseudomonadota bacterium]
MERPMKPIPPQNRKIFNHAIISLNEPHYKFVKACVRDIITDCQINGVCHFKGTFKIGKNAHYKELSQILEDCIIETIQSNCVHIDTYKANISSTGSLWRKEYLFTFSGTFKTLN